ncbi:MAG: hypothetical protein WCK01_00320 [Candidatus Uhrbacteria bacterium]
MQDPYAVVESAMYPGSSSKPCIRHPLVADALVECFARNGAPFQVDADAIERARAELSVRVSRSFHEVSAGLSSDCVMVSFDKKHDTALRTWADTMSRRPREFVLVDIPDAAYDQWVYLERPGDRSTPAGMHAFEGYVCQARVLAVTAARVAGLSLEFHVLADRGK